MPFLHSRIVFPSFLLLLLTLTACPKKDPEPSTITPTEDFARRYLFRQGSTWTYKDSANGLTDQMTLDTCWSGRSKLGPRGAPTMYQIDHNGDYSHSRIGALYLQAYSTGRTEPYNFVISGVGGTVFVLGYGLEKGLPGMGWGTSEDIVLKDTAATLNIAGETIEEIHVFALDSATWSSQPRPIFKECWWAKNIGLVRYKLNTGQTFTLESRQATPYWPLP